MTDDGPMMIARGHAARFALMIAVVVAVAACAGPVGSRPETPVEPARSAAPTFGGAPTPSASQAPALGASEPSGADPVGVLGQAWAVAPLVDVATGETFRIADHAGKVVIVETMAIWCTNCRTQQTNVEAALGRLPAGRVVYLILDVDPNESTESLAQYREHNGFHGRYAVAGKDVARALAADFGDQFLNPPSTPILVVSTDGTVTRTDFGQKSADDIVALARAAGA